MSDIISNDAPLATDPRRTIAMHASEPVAADQLASSPLARLLNVRRLRWLDGAVVFLSAFLLFQIQPLIANAILPWFGGSAGVWGVCLIFFQSTLLAGYLYAHLLTHALSPRVQLGAHAVALLLAAMLLRVLPAASQAPQDIAQPIGNILLILATTVGLPYLLLSSTSPLLQVWFARANLGQPYGLYALSNLGSMLGLLTYPFLVQPLFGVRAQAAFWAVGFFAFAALCVTAAVGTNLMAAPDDQSHAAIRPANQIKSTSRARSVAAWLLLSACPSALLLATTNVLCLDVASTPFLWVVPLSLYLLSLIICFAAPRVYWPRTFAAVAIVGLFATAWTINQKASWLSLLEQIALYNAGLFAVCMLCHGEMVRQRPAQTERLTAFYLTTSLGGALGGSGVALLAPLVFRSFYEYHAVSLLSLAIAVAVFFRPSSAAARGSVRAARRAREPVASSRGRSFTRAAGAIIVSVAFILVLSGVGSEPIQARRLDVDRDFYGVVAVYETSAEVAGFPNRTMLHGRVRHGVQCLAEEFRRTPFLYYHADSGIGWTFQQVRARRPTLRVGVVGLGAGTLACYGQPGDDFRFYEISPVVRDMAERYFTFLADSPAATDCVLGDARVSLDREAPRQYDILVLDAFSGDAIPLHLLTREALRVYLKHLQPDGVLAFHITNTHLDLTGPVHALAVAAELADVQILTGYNPAHGQMPARWHLLTRDHSLVERAIQSRTGHPPAAHWTAPWSDDTCNLFSVLR